MPKKFNKFNFAWSLKPKGWTAQRLVQVSPSSIQVRLKVNVWPIHLFIELDMITILIIKFMGWPVRLATQVRRMSSSMRRQKAGKNVIRLEHTWGGKKPNFRRNLVWNGELSKKASESEKEGKKTGSEWYYPPLPPPKLGRKGTKAIQFLLSFFPLALLRCGGIIRKRKVRTVQGFLSCTCSLFLLASFTKYLRM